MGRILAIVLATVGALMMGGAAYARTDAPLRTIYLANAYPAADLLLIRSDTQINLGQRTDVQAPVRPRYLPQDDDLNLFRSVALPVGPIASTRKWQAVEVAEENMDVPATLSRMLDGLAEATLLPDVQALALVNRTVNRAIAYRADRGDQWSTAAQTAARGAGDCEDYAILKRWLLLQLGFEEDQLQLVLLKDRRRGLNHAVLAVHLEGGTLILDSLLDRTADDTAFRNYMPIVSFRGRQTYIHGFES